MTTAKFTIGNEFRHYNGYTWKITNISGKKITLESDDQTSGSKVIGTMTISDLKSLISAKYYKPISHA